MSTKRYVDLVLYKSLMDLKSENSQTYLGVLWWIVEPLLYLLAFYLIFDVVMQRGGEGFVVFLLCGLVFWRWFDTVVKKSASAIPANVGIINQVYLPKIIFPVIDAVSATLRFIFVLIIFLIFLALYSKNIPNSWGFLPILLGIQFFLALGLGLILSVGIAFFPDLKKLLDNFLMFMFWMSGIFYAIGETSDQIRIYFNINPMAVLIEQYRVILLEGLPPSWLSLFLVFVASIFISIIGWLLVRYFDSDFTRIVKQ